MGYRVSVNRQLPDPECETGAAGLKSSRKFW